jgi:predicted dehydrogenase
VAKTPKKLRVAMIGAGGIAGTHMAYLQKMDDVDLVAIADVNEEALARQAKTYNVSQTFVDFKEMLAKANPEAVSVCTPNGLHAPCTIAALNAGAHVLVEKPMAMNAKEAQAMLDAATKNKKKLVIGFQYRFGSNSTFLRNAYDSGTLGKVMYARSQALRRRGIPNWGVFGRKELQGGGPMIDIGVHILEVTHFCMGSPKPVAAFGATWTYMGNKKSDTVSMWPNWDHKTYTVEDLAVGQIRFDTGAILTIESSFVAHIEKDVWGFSLMGEKGGASWDPPAIFRDDNRYMVNQTPAYIAPSGFGDHFQMKMRNFVEHVLYNKPTLAPAEDGVAVQKMLDGIYESAAKGKEVAIG